MGGRDRRQGRFAGGGQRVPNRVRELPKAAPAVHADETPARSADAINAGQVLPCYQGSIVRGGYHGYSHLTAFSRAKYRKRRKVGSATEVAERLLYCLH